MATTTNYGWTTPDDTALVKDGAAAIRTLGSSVDTTTKALNPSTTLGDIEYRSSTANTNTRLGIGTTGQVLSVTGGVPAWESISSGGLTLISTTTLTGASVTLSSIPSTYVHLQLVIKNYKPATDGASLNVAINADTTASRYFSITTNNARNGGTVSGTFDDSSAAIYAQNDNGTAEGLTIIDIPDYTNATTRKFITYKGVTTSDSSTSEFKWSFGNAVYNQTTAITSLLLQGSSGNFTSGTVLLYGVK
jgi:hypothetical protein